MAVYKGCNRLFLCRHLWNEIVIVCILGSIAIWKVKYSIPYFVFLKKISFFSRLTLFVAYLFIIVTFLLKQIQ